MKAPKETPQAYILRLIRSTTDDALIAQSCNAKFRTHVSAERVAELRRAGK